MGERYRARTTTAITEGASDYSPGGEWCGRGTVGWAQADAMGDFSHSFTPDGRPFGFSVYAHEIEPLSNSEGEDATRG